MTTPFELVTVLQGTQAPETTIDFVVSQTHVFEETFSVCPIKQITLETHERVAPFHWKPVLHTQPLVVAAPVDLVTVEHLMH